MNIPSLNERTLRRDIAACSFMTGTEIQVGFVLVYMLSRFILSYSQVATLDEAVRLLPDAIWWLKADGVDVVAGIHESVSLEWNGDVDLNDGEVQKMREAYLNRLSFIGSIGMGTTGNLQHQLSTLEAELEEDLTYL